MFQILIGSLLTVMIGLIGGVSKAFYELLKDIRNEMRTMNNNVVAQGVDIANLNKQVTDHEGRIRVLEKK